MDRVAEIQAFMEADKPAAFVTHFWTTNSYGRREKVEQWNEQRNYIFATDTTTTTNSTLPWKNTTTLPKLCQIRDNLKANYMAALFPNDNWLQWLGYTQEADMQEKRKLIQAYMGNKLRQDNFRSTIGRLVDDYIDYGNAFAYSGFKAKYKKLPDGTEVPDYVGPTAGRISPLDIVFDATASDFHNTWKVVRSVKSLGEIKRLIKDNPGNEFWQKALDRRDEIKNFASGYSFEDFDKAIGFQMDGFNSMYEYFNSNRMEVLEFYGDYYDEEAGELHSDKVLTIVDRSMTVRVEDQPEWYTGGPITHVGWRDRPDNLWSMGPLENLVGLQYRLDHLENLKADAMDLMVHPPLKIIGEVEQFNWGPGAEIHIDEGGSDVQELGMHMGKLMTANQEMQLIEDRMELYAGAPREAMGVRSPGEKTAFEVQQLETAAGRIFQSKITKFEVELLEPLLNQMFEQAQRNMVGSDVVRVLNDEIGVEVFKTITQSDIIASGILRPVGARHFAQKAQDLQNLTQVFNTGIAPKLEPHTSALELTRFINDTLQLQGYNIFAPNVGVQENADTMESAQLAEEEMMRRDAQQQAAGMM